MILEFSALINPSAHQFPACATLALSAVGALGLAVIPSLILSLILSLRAKLACFRVANGSRIFIGVVLALGLALLVPKAGKAVAWGGSDSALDTGGTPAQSDAHSSRRRQNKSWQDGYSNDETFVIVTAGSSSVTMSGDTSDIRRATSLKNKIPVDFIWFVRDGRAYVITDPATVRAAKELFAPQEELGRQQADLGQKQAALGEKQSELGRQQTEVRVNVPDLTEDLRRIQARMKGAKTQEELSELQSELSDLQSKLSEVQEKASEEQSQLGEKQSELGEQQSELGEQQSKLGEEQSRLAEKASRELARMLDEALKNGLATLAP
ncbi:MAG TPA: hypothetical protein VLZ81_05415 [Blastocatellia bacterium]|nr:hypothetical protein [Blastocatellia bacterium]